MKQIFIIGGAVLSFLLSSLAGNAQISQGGSPRSSQKWFSIPQIPEMEMGGIDEAKLRAEDAERAKLGKEFNRRFGYTFDVSFHTENSGIWTLLPNGDRIWQLTITSKDARSLNLTFSKFWLPKGADLFLTGEKNKIGALTEFNNQADQKLGTGLIGGSWITLEYYEPLSTKGQGIIEVGKVTHGYKDPFSTLGWGDSDDCEMNVNCPLGAAWQNEKRAVARIIDNGDVCTGTLLNNALQDAKPYFLTANHCYSASSTTWVFSFNWEAPGCTTPTTAIPENQTISGSTLKARNAKSDFCLFELSAKPPANFNVYYCGWSAENVPSTYSTIIHHPSGDIKKITFDDDPVTSSGYGVGSTNDNSHWQTGNYEFGTTTEGGSSGSAIFDQNHRVVGQLHGGPASCTNIAQDFYGKFSMSWAEGTTPATRLKDWLDPLNTGIVTINGLDPACRRIAINLPYQPRIDTVVKPLPYLWKVKNPNGDSTFHLVNGGYGLPEGKAFNLVADNFNPAGRRDSLLLSPVSMSRYKKIRFSFAHAYRRRAPDISDTLSIMVSQNCGSSFRLLNKWSGNALVTDPTTGATAVFQPTDTLLWVKHEIELDSTYNQAEQLVFAFGFSSQNAGNLWLDQFRIIGDTAKDKPFARFEASQKNGCASVQIQFEDSSKNNPTAWNWTFDGGTPATSTLQNPTVTYNNTGTYKVTLRVTNEEGSDTLVEDNYIQIFELGNTNTPFAQAFPANGTFPPTGYLLLNPENNVTWVLNPNINGPGSTGGSLMFDNYSNPNVTGNRDQIILPKISTIGKSHLKMRFKLAYKYYTSFGQVSPDTLTIGYTRGCGGQFLPLWKKGGTQLATAGAFNTGIYTPAAADWATIQLDLDSLLSYPEVAIGFENLFGYGNRIFIDDLKIDTIETCPLAPTVTVNTDSVCIGKQLVLAMDSLSDAAYSWSGPSNFTASTRVATRNITAQNMAGVYRGTVTKDNCQSPATTQQIAVFANPTVPNFTQAGNTLTGPANMSHYMWIVDGTDTLAADTRIIEAPISGSYVLIVTNAGGCSNTSVPKNVLVTGVRTATSQNAVSAFPVPATDWLVVNLQNSGNQTIALFNSLGKNILPTICIQRENYQEKLSIQHLAPGTYWIQVLESNKLTTIPIIKAK